MTRREAREEAFLLLFEHDFKEEGTEENMALAAEAREMKISGFGKGLYLGAVENMAAIDVELDKALHNWDRKRISKVAHAALRLGAYEIMFTDTDTEIAVNEALELIKKFDGEESASFAHGVLGGLYKSVKAAE